MSTIVNFGRLIGKMRISDRSTFTQFRGIFTLFLLVSLAQGCRNFDNFWEGKKDNNVTVGGGGTTNPNQVIAPVYAPAGGTYNATQNVALTSGTAGAIFCYTTDGVTNPVCNDTVPACTTGTTYSGPISVPANQTLIALACKTGMITSVNSTAVYVIDSTAPVIGPVIPAVNVAPASNASVNNTQVSYNLSETCTTGSITWTRTGGTADGSSPHVQALTGSELNAGDHNNMTLTNNPSLVANAVYSVAFNCTDAAGNAATTVTSTNVTFDNVPPVISAVAPATGAFVNSKLIGYTFSESCQSAQVQWNRTGGAADGASPHNMPLAGGDLAVGVHTGVNLNPTIVDGAVYTLTFTCSDAAGNAAAPIVVTGVTYDVTIPVISGVSPVDSSFVNTTQVTYTMTETCASATINWTRTGGAADPGSPHNQALTPAERAAGTYNNITITNNPTLVSGAVYSMAFNCTDAAGNAAATVNRTNITFDSTGPVISGVAPSTGAYVNNKLVNYTFSENCASAQVQWQRTGGSADGASPHNMALTAGDLTAGVHTGVNKNPPIVDGAIYTVTFSCTDAAANVATPIVITGVTYDVTPPVISGVLPTASVAVNHTMVSYTLSETCSTASITWTRTGGIADGASPHTRPLIAGEMTPGAHSNFTISNNPTLVSGAIYSLTFACSDLATNLATAVNVTSVTYDVTPPTIVLQNLRNNGIVHTNTIIGTATDPIGTLTQVEFNLDSSSWNAAAGIASWNFGLPTGASTWRDRTQHNIQVRSRDSAGNFSTVTSINVRKGNNRDVNADGYEDLAVSAYKDASFRGKVHIFHGTPTGITQMNLTSPPPNSTLTGEAGTTRFGRNFAMGDFNADGYADIAVGATTYNTSDGAVYIFSGSASGVPTATAAPGNRITAPASSVENFGSPLVAGDVNADGYADVAIGANGAGTWGKVYLYFGGGGGIPAGVASTSAPVSFVGENTSPNPAGQFGSSIIIGDFDADGNTDIGVGAPAFPSGATANFGRAYMFYGGAGGFTPGTYNAGLTTTIATGTAATHFLGGSMSAGDLNNDGATDLTTGGYGNGTSSSFLRIYYGASGSRPLANNSATPATTITQPTNGVFLSTAVASEDFNGDGYADIAVGSHGGTVNAGSAYIFFGQATQLSVTTVGSANYTVNGEFTGHQFGRGVGGFDVNGDGFPDLMVGANFYATAATVGDTGKVYIYNGSSSGPTAYGPGAADRMIVGNTGTEFGIAFSR